MIFTVEAGESAFAILVAIHESDDKLGQLLTVLRFRDEAVPGATHTHLQWHKVRAVRRWRIRTKTCL